MEWTCYEEIIETHGLENVEMFSKKIMGFPNIW
jgi:hypothetical protein